MNPIRRNFLKLAATIIAAPEVPRLASQLIFRLGRFGSSRPLLPAAASISPRAWIGHGSGERPGVLHRREQARRRRQRRHRGRSPRAADGYTLLLATLPNAVNTSLYEKLNFNFIRDTVWSRASSACPWWCCSIQRFRQGRFPSSSAMPGPIRTRSTWRRPATEPHPTWPANCSR